MLKHLWLTGIFSAFSVFGIKTGLGLSAQIYNREISLEKKLLFSVAVLDKIPVSLSCFVVIANHDRL
ncbi:hypothetical protein [Desulfonema magnum]|uniref:Uncharacterized protein n=1 Tax=Desulfonema magnum TaxID=45655 RepID=A0A975GLJ1_9BACT|nr:hypothetical protein [Desulfonema magnum]QTA85901.1 Uncharacterized protein dnm_019180 [Desulfonema magnum]